MYMLFIAVGLYVWYRVVSVSNIGIVRVFEKVTSSSCFLMFIMRMKKVRFGRYGTDIEVYRDGCKS